MKHLLRCLVAALILLPAAHGARAACSVSSITVGDQGGTPFVFCTGGSSGAYLNQNQIIDSTGANILGVNASGQIGISNTSFAATQSGTWNLTNIGGTISLPTGAATSALQTSGNNTLTTINSSLGTINTTLGTPLQAGGSIGNTTFGATQSGAWNLTNISGTISLPTGAATSALQTTANTTLSTINTTLGAPMQATGGTVQLVAGAALVGGFNAYQGGSLVATGNALFVQPGTAATFPISAATLPLPTGAATAVGLTNGTQKTQVVDGSGNVIASTSNNLNVQCANCSGSGVSTGDEASFTPGTSLFAGGGGFFQTTPTSNALASGQQGMFQTTANRALFTNLRSAAGAELGIAAAPLQVSVANTAANGTAVLTTGTGGTFPVTQPTAANLNATVVGSGVFQVGPTASANTAGNPFFHNLVVGGAVVSTTNGIYTNLLQGNAVLSSTNPIFSQLSDGTRVSTIKAASTASATGDTSLVVQLNPVQPNLSTALNVSAAQTGTWNINNISGTQTLPTGASTSALQTTGNTALTTINTTLGSPFQAGGSIGNTTFASTQSGTWNINNVSGTVSLPTGAATSALQTAGNTTLTTINTTLGTPFQSGGSIGNTSFTATQATPANLKTASYLNDGSGNAISSTSGALNVNISSGGALGQDTATTGQQGSLVMGAVTTAAPTYTSTHSDPISLDTAGNLRVNCTSGCNSTGGTNSADEATFTFGTTPLTLGGGVYQTTATSNPLTSGQGGALQLTINRAAHTNLRNSTGTEMGTTTNPLQVSIANTGVNTTPIVAKIDQTTDGVTNAVEIPPSAAAANGITPIVSGAAEASHVLKSGAGNLYSVYVTTGATAGYLMVFNATSAPADGAVTPVDCTQAPAAATTGLNTAGAPPDAYSTGIVVVFSTTGCFTKTASATAFFKGKIK